MSTRLVVLQQFRAADSKAPTARTLLNLNWTMFSLTEGTLFFLDLALSTRTRDQKPPLNSIIQKWVDGVAAATDGSANNPHTTTRASSTLYAPSLYLSATVGQASPSSGGCEAASGSGAQNVLSLSKASFSACYEHDAMEIALDHYDEASMDTSEMDMPSSAMDSDNDRSSLDLDMPVPQWHRKAPRAVKRKMDDANIESDGNRDEGIHLEEPISGNTRQVEEMPSVGVKIERSALPPKKKVKREDASAPLLFAFPDPALDYTSSACTALPQSLQRRRVDNQGYLCKAIKRSSEYTTKDLPIPCDQRWSHGFISTAILWYSVQKNVWNVPTEEFASALQCIFNVVYPDARYIVTTAGPVFALALQRINEWRCSFGSSALAIMLHFFSSLDDDDRVRSAAEFLATDFRFLREDPDSSEPTEMFRSPFLLILIAITHLGDTAAFVDVPGWDTRAMAAGKGGEGVIAIASAALEHAMTHFCEGTLDVDLLTETTRCPDAPPALRFSSANWSNPTAAYREAVRKRGSEFVCALFAAAQAKRRRIARDDDSEADAGVSVSGVPDPRSLL